VVNHTQGLPSRGREVGGSVFRGNDHPARVAAARSTRNVVCPSVLQSYKEN
jgi:hypothetical protein